MPVATRSRDLPPNRANAVRPASTADVADLLGRELVFTAGRLTERELPLPTIPRGKGRKGQVVILADQDARGRGPTAERIRQGLIDAYYQHPSGSLTSALVRSIQQLNEELYAENESTIRGERGYATLACAILREGEVYFALVGRALAYLVGPAGGERLGRGDPHPGERPLDLLGQVEDAEIQLFHRPLNDPAALILATSGIADLAGGDLLAALPTTPCDVVPSLHRLAESTGERPFRAIVLTPGEEDDPDDDETDQAWFPESRRQPEGSGLRLDSRSTEMTVRTTPSADRLERRPSWRPAPAEAQTPRAPLAWTSQTRPIQLPESRLAPDQSRRRDRPEAATTPRNAMDRAVREEPVFPGSRRKPTPPGLRLDPETTGTIAHPAHGAGPRQAAPASRGWDAGSFAPTANAGSGSTAPPRRLAPSHVDSPRFAPGGRSLAAPATGWLEADDGEDAEDDSEWLDEEAAGPTPLASALDLAVGTIRRVVDRTIDDGRPLRALGRGGAGLLTESAIAILRAPGEHTRLAILALVMFLVGYVCIQVPVRMVRGGAAYAQATADLSQASQREQQAMSEQDPLVRRHLLETAGQLASQAHADQPADPLIATALTRIQSEYAAATDSAALGAPVRLVTLPTPGDQLVVNGLDLYVLDRANSQAYRYMLNADGATVEPSQKPVIVAKGDQIGAVTVGQLTQMTWMPSGGARPRPALLLLDSAGYFVQYDPTAGLGVLAAGDPSSWANVATLAGSGGDLYALSATNRTLARFPPGQAGYDSGGYNYLAASTQTDLSDVTAMAVADGSVYLEHASGPIEKLTDGKPANFTAAPRDLLPAHPVGLALGGGSIFVGDPARARVVQLTQDGVYQRTLGADSTAAVLGHLRDLAVSSDGKVLYALTADGIYRIDVPDPS